MQTAQSYSSGRSHQRGFALIATISVMTLLVMVALAMLSLSTIEMRYAQQSGAIQDARANARLALMLAIGELQSSMGPDQRISASSSILADDSSGRSPDDPDFDASSVDSSFAKTHVLGVWNAWKTWQTEPEFKATYLGKSRESQFKRWLISHPDPSKLSNIEWAAQSYSIPTATLVDRGTLGPDSDAQHIVEAPLVSVSHGENKGAYAWQVFGENQKGTIDLYKTPQEDSAAFSGMLLSNSSMSDMQQLDADMSAYPSDSTNLAKVVSISSAQLFDASTPYKNAFKKRFHSLTAGAYGLPVNVREGGFKNDLNTLLELPSLPSEFGTAYNPKSIRGNDGYFDSTQYGDLSRNFTSWYKLHQYYQQYRGADGYANETRADQITTAATLKGVHLSGNKPHANFNWHHGNLDQQGWGRTPITTRLMLELGIKTKRNSDPTKRDFTMSFNPVMTVWNPYNVSMKIPKLHTEIFPGSIEYKVYINGVAAGDWKQVRRSGGGNKLFNIYTMKGKGKSFAPIDFLPGEVRMFSAVPSALTGADNLHVELYPGYEPLANGGGFDIKLADLTGIDSGKNVEIAVRINSSRYTADDTKNGSVQHRGAFQFYWTVRQEATGGKHRFNEMGATPIEHGRPIYLIEDSPGKRLPFPSGTNGQRQQFGTFSFELKTSDNYPDIPYYGNKDLRCKNFALANPTNQRAMYGQATDRTKALAQYVNAVQIGAGGATSPDITSDNRGFYGPTHRAQSAEGYQGQNFVPLLELPLSPCTSLAAFDLMRLNPGKTNMASKQHLWDISTNSAMGIGSAFANPLIPGDSVYNDVPDAIAGDTSSTDGLQNKEMNKQMKLIRDFHDHVFINNDALYDAWFCSGVTHQDTSAFSDKRSIKTVLDDFFTDPERPLPNSNYRPRVPDSQAAKDLASSLVSSSDPKDDTYQKMARYLKIKGAFNINSTSVDAWRSLFYGLKLKSFSLVDPKSGALGSSVTTGKVLISRLATPASQDEGLDAGSPASWTGVRYLTEAQIDRLSRECVRQVKLRGPFLNMADFVNRRLQDNEMGVCGALQAAIDYDEYNGNSPKPSDDESINARYKKAADMIDSNSTSNWNAGASLPFERAHYGSRWTGIPGYVTQADVLRRIGNQLTPRDDCFRIRVYGESLSSDGSRVLARAWAEAVVGRSHEYLDSSDDEELQYDDLKTINQRFGRKFRILSFRWLSKEEV